MLYINNKPAFHAEMKTEKGRIIVDICTLDHGLARYETMAINAETLEVYACGREKTLRQAVILYRAFIARYATEELESYIIPGESNI